MKIARATLIGLVVIAILTVAGLYLHSHVPAVLNPAGPVALQERNLLVFAVLLMMLVVVPVYVLTAVFAWRYRASNTKAKYSPHLEGSRLVETIWWLIPTAIIGVLAVLAWTSSHQLDPGRPLASANSTLTIQVVALDWKWLFLYPQQNIATVGYVEIPQNTPVDFQITSDAPMNSFWIPRLGGQIYAMPGMSTDLHLMASQTGSYQGSSANISGVGFSGMTFTAHAATPSDFAHWAATAEASPHRFTAASYEALARPSQNQPTATYALSTPSLYDAIVAKYMVPGISLP